MTFSISTFACWSRRALLGLATTALVGTALPAMAQTSAPSPGPALWVVRDADSTLYLFGTVHVLKPETVWRQAHVEGALAASDSVIFEISNPDDQAAILPLIQTQGLSPSRPLSSLLNAEETAKLDAAARAIGVSAAQMDPMRPWLAALSLAMAPLTKAGYDAHSGVELILKAQATAAGKPITGLETLDQQVQVLAGLSEDVQLDFLRSALDDYEEAAVELDRMVAAWAEGDVETLERIGVEDLREAGDELYEALLVRRNADWMRQIETLMAGSGTTFMAVGAAHLVGEDSVQSMLESRGHRVMRQ